MVALDKFPLLYRYQFKAKKSQYVRCVKLDFSFNKFLESKN